MIMPGMTETVDFTSYSVGTWLLHWCASRSVMLTRMAIS